MIKRLSPVGCAGLLISIFTHMNTQAVEAAPGTYEQPQDKFHVFVMAGDATIGQPAEATAETPAIKRCYVLNEKDEWEPARVADGLGYGFANAMLAANPDIEIGLVYCTAPGTKIEEWHIKSEYYRHMRRRTKVARRQGALKGVVWRHGKSVRYSALDHMKDLVTNVRADQAALELPFVVGEVHENTAMNTQLAALVSDVHAVGLAPIDGLPVAEKEGLDEKGLQQLGQRCARQMLRLQGEWAARDARRARRRIPIIDTHIHGSSNKEGGLDVLVKWMDRNQVSHCITHALTPTRPENEQQRAAMRANFAKYKDRILRFTYIEPGEVSSVEEAVAILEKEKADGAVGFGEHYGRGLMFDDPGNLLLYAACEKVGFPVMFHIDSSKNMVERRMHRVERVLEMYPKCILIAHAAWWSYLPDGTCDRMLRKYPNLYADVSGLAMTAVLNRDRGYTREFLTRNADKIMFGSDEGWWSLKDAQSEHLTFELFEQLDLPDDVRRKIYRGNAERLFGVGEP